MIELRQRLRAFIWVVFFILIAGTLGFMFTEGLSLVDAFYFSIVTIATVGYGDIHPNSAPGKILAIVLIIGGVGTFLGVVANASEMLINRREQKIRTQKLHMVIGLFFSEVGTKLLRHFSKFDPQLDHIRKKLIITTEWSETDFAVAIDQLSAYDYIIDMHRGNLEKLLRYIEAKGDFLVRLLENPLLLEHENFTDLLMAIFHLREELLSREDTSKLPTSDYLHLAGDMKRAYDLLVYQWIGYMKYLKVHYPYLFSHAMRTNPFDPAASVIVT